jgi:tetratricopeptide (TPR) repeat protein
MITIKNFRFFMMLLLCLTNKLSKAQKVEGELRGELHYADSDSLRARLCGLLAWELRYTKPGPALEFADKELSIARQENNLIRFADAFRVKAFLLVKSGKIMDGMLHFDSALVFAKRSGSFFYEASCYELIADMYFGHTDYEKAIALYAKAFEPAKRSGDLPMISRLNAQLAESFRISGGRKEYVQKYYSAALDNSVKLEDWAGAALVSIKLASEYVKHRQTSNALAELERSVELVNRDKTDALKYATNCHLLGSLYLAVGWLEEAERYALASIKIMERMERHDSLLPPLALVTNVYLKRGNTYAAEKYATRLIEEAMDRQSTFFIRDSYKAFIDIARLKYDNAAAAGFYEQYISYNETLSQLNKEQVISGMEKKAKLAHHEMELSCYLEKNALLKEKMKEHTTNFRDLMIIVTTSILIITGLTLFLVLLKRKINKINLERSN